MKSAIVCGVALLCLGCRDAVAPKDEIPIVIAHRGASQEAPEHTLAAYDLAVNQGADYIEQDIARTNDGVIVVIHDATLDRTARGPAAACTGSVREKTLAQLRSCDFGSWFNEVSPSRARATFSALRILTLAEVFERYRGKAGFYVEIKDPELYPGIEEALANLIRSAALPAIAEKPAVFVQSFDASALQRFRAHVPTIPLIQLVGDEPAAATILARAQLRFYASGIAPRADRVIPETILAFSSLCMVVHPYVVNDENALRSLRRAGVHGVITDLPGAARSIFEDEPPPLPLSCLD